MDVFVSVGTGLSPKQDTFVLEVENRLRAVGLSPHTIGRNTFSTDAPLRAVSQLMDRCSGAVVIALERYWCEQGIERRGSHMAKPMSAVSMATPWNQIEAAMAYSRGLPLLVLVDENVRCDGLLEKGNDWFVCELAVDVASLGTPSFLGLLESWRARLTEPKKKADLVNPSKISVKELVGALTLPQIWALLGAAIALLSGAFTLGAKYEDFVSPRATESAQHSSLGSGLAKAAR